MNEPNSSHQLENPVGSLQELMQKKGWPLPKYSIMDNEGSNEFIMQASLVNGLQVTVKATSKKSAKAKAAGELLSLLDDSTKLHTFSEASSGSSGDIIVVSQPIATANMHLIGDSSEKSDSKAKTKTKKRPDLHARETELVRSMPYLRMQDKYNASIEKEREAHQQQILKEQQEYDLFLDTRLQQAKECSEKGPKVSIAEMKKRLALDCEMVGTGPKGCRQILARVSVVDWKGDVVFDSYVAPSEEVTDYRTFISGIRPEHLKDAPRFSEVQSKLFHLFSGKVLVGHSVSNDFEVLDLSHENSEVRDTAFFFRKGNRSGGLKKLALHYFKEVIQTGSHDSVEDARATMKLYVMFSDFWETKKELWGVNSSKRGKKAKDNGDEKVLVNVKTDFKLPARFTDVSVPECAMTEEKIETVLLMVRRDWLDETERIKVYSSNMELLFDKQISFESAFPKELTNKIGKLIDNKILVGNKIHEKLKRVKLRHPNYLARDLSVLFPPKSAKSDLCLLQNVLKDCKIPVGKVESLLPKNSLLSDLAPLVIYHSVAATWEKLPEAWGVFGVAGRASDVKLGEKRNHRFRGGGGNWKRGGRYPRQQREAQQANQKARPEAGADQQGNRHQAGSGPRSGGGRRRQYYRKRGLSQQAPA